MVNFSVSNFQKELKESTIGHSTIAEFLCWWIHIFFLVTNRFFQKNTTHQQIPMVPRFLEGAVVPLAYTKAAKASAINRAFHQQKSGNLSRQKWNMNSKQKVTCIAYMGIFTDQRKKI